MIRVTSSAATGGSLVGNLRDLLRQPRVIDYTYAVSCRRPSPPVVRMRQACLLVLALVLVVSALPGLVSTASAVPASRPHRSATATWWVIAHRGDFGRHVTQDGLRALRRALSKGATMAETDLRPSRDHRLIVLHDHMLGDTTNCHVAVYARTAAWISRHCRLRDGSRVPTVVDYLRTARAHHGQVMLELKRAPNWTRLAHARLASAIRRTGMTDRVVITSMSSKLLRPARAALPGLTRWGWISNGRTPTVRSVRRHHADLVLAQVQDLTLRRVRALHAAGIPVIGAVYRHGRQVTRLRQWRRLYDVDADGFLTDHLRRAMAWSHRLRRHQRSKDRAVRVPAGPVVPGPIRKLAFPG